MSETTTKLGPYTYSIGRMSTMEQFHVARRLAPILASVTGAFKKAIDSTGDSTEDKDTDALSVALPPIADVVSRMSDADTEYIISKCLSVCKRQTEQQTWAALTTRGGQLMFQDMDLQTLMGLTIAVIKENLGSFFPDGEQPFPGVAG